MVFSILILNSLYFDKNKCWYFSSKKRMTAGMFSVRQALIIFVRAHISRQNSERRRRRRRDRRLAYKMTGVETSLTPGSFQHFKRRQSSIQSRHVWLTAPSSFARWQKHFMSRSRRRQIPKPGDQGIGMIYVSLFSGLCSVIYFLYRNIYSKFIRLNTIEGDTWNICCSTVQTIHNKKKKKIFNNGLKSLFKISLLSSMV